MESVNLDTIEWRKGYKSTLISCQKIDEANPDLVGIEVEMSWLTSF
jgi:hypothetical protein